MRITRLTKFLTAATASYPTVVLGRIAPQAAR